MNHQTDQIWTLLQESGIVLGEQPEKEVSGSPWYVKVLLAFSGWLAAIFLLGFIGAAFEYVFKNSGIAGLVGVIMIAGAFALLRLHANEFVEHLGLATSMAGQALIIYAIFDLSHPNECMAWLLLAILQSALVAVMPNFVHRVISTLVAAIALSMALDAINIPYIVGGVLLFGISFCWLNEFRYPRQMKKMRAVGYGLVLAFVALKGAASFGYRAFSERFLHEHAILARFWLGEIVIGIVTVYVVWSLLQRYGQPMNGRLSMTTLVATLLVCTISIKVQGIAVGMVIVCLGFFGANRVLLGLGIVSLLFYISSYYYLLDATLLDKSLSLLVTGLVLLFVRGLLLYIIPIHKEAEHA